MVYHPILTTPLEKCPKDTCVGASPASNTTHAAPPYPRQQPQNAKVKGYEFNPSRMGGPRNDFAPIAFMGHLTRSTSHRHRGPHHKRKSAKGIDKFISPEPPTRDLEETRKRPNKQNSSGERLPRPRKEDDEALTTPWYGRNHQGSLPKINTTGKP